MKEIQIKDREEKKNKKEGQESTQYDQGPVRIFKIQNLAPNDHTARNQLCHKQKDCNKFKGIARSITMMINFHPAILFSLLLLPTQTMSAPCTQGMGYEFFVNGNCNYENFKEGFNTYFTDATAMKTAGCSNTVDQEIAELFGTAAGAETKAAVDAACKAAFDAKEQV